MLAGALAGPSEPQSQRLAADSNAWTDNEIATSFAWLFQNLFHTQTRWKKCNASERQNDRVHGAFVEALFRTRTGDPLLTMERLRQPVATHGNGFGVFPPFPCSVDLPLVGTGCNHGAP
jgi:hypothetical protein